MYKQPTTKEQVMVKSKKDERKFCNVALLPEDHEMLRNLADEDQRSMTRQLSVIIKKEWSRLFEAAKV